MRSRFLQLICECACRNDCKNIEKAYNPCSKCVRTNQFEIIVRKRYEDKKTLLEKFNIELQQSLNLPTINKQYYKTIMELTIKNHLETDELNRFNIILEEKKTSLNELKQSHDAKLAEFKNNSSTNKVLSTEEERQFLYQENEIKAHINEIEKLIFESKNKINKFEKDIKDIQNVIQESEILTQSHDENISETSGSDTNSDSTLTEHEDESSSDGPSPDSSVSHTCTHASPTSSDSESSTTHPRRLYFSNLGIHSQEHSTVETSSYIETKLSAIPNLATS